MPRTGSGRQESRGSEPLWRVSTGGAVEAPLAVITNKRCQMLMRVRELGSRCTLVIFVPTRLAVSPSRSRRGSH